MSRGKVRDMIFQRLGKKSSAMRSSSLDFSAQAALCAEAEPYCPCPKRTVAALFPRIPEASRPRKWAQPTGQLN
jgi:hypothetical protein